MPKPKKVKKLATCDGTSTTHQDYELTYAYIINHGVAKEVQPGGAVYFEVQLPMEAMAREVFAGHPNSYGRLRSVFNHMLNGRTAEGEHCCEIIPFKGRSQGRERIFCAREDQDEVLLRFEQEDAFKHFQGLAQGHKRRSTEVVNDRQRFMVAKVHYFNSGDFEGYRLAANCLEEIDRDGDVKPATMAALIAHQEVPATVTPRRSQ